MEDDEDELLQASDDESSGTEDQDHENYTSTETQCGEHYLENQRHPSVTWNQSKCEFLITKAFLIFSSTCLIILLPTYLDSLNIQSDAYNLILMNSSLTVVSLVLIFVFGKVVFKAYKNLGITNYPIKFSQVLILSLVYTTSGFLVIYSIDRKKVMCHLQDPMKGSLLVFSLLSYFIFCKKFMGLQRIFSATTIIVGLFIAVDYGLCDEFRCRGFERVNVSDDTGNWPWKIHSFWIAIYVLGLVLFSGYFTLLERYLLVNDSDIPVPVNTTPLFLTTISRSVAFPVVENGRNIVRHNQTVGDIYEKFSALHVTLYVHVLSLLMVTLTFWTDIIPSIGKGSSVTDFLNLTSKGIICHFQPQFFQSKELSECGNTFIFSWLFMGCYVLFSVISVKFLMMSQSAVYTVATMSSSLPLVSIWWTLFKLFPLQNGGSVIIWSPSLSGELICSLLGLPIVLVGLFLFCKSHFKEYQWSGRTSNYITMPPHLS